MTDNNSNNQTSDEDNDYEPSFLPQDTKEESPHFTQSEQIKSQQKLEEKVKLKSAIPNNAQFFGDLADKTEEALQTFTNLEESTYANKQIGDSGQNGDYMSCVCSEDYEDGINSACFDDDCINRGTKIECVNGSSSCGENCANQRFQKKQYTAVNVILTEKKGYGVRVQEDVEPDSLIYEYIGEVIDEKTFKKRMINYDKEGIKHFYFMMLQKGEFVDATKKGSLGRFLNHSCNPNCYVEKWVVADKLKMGIFSKRKVLKNEELTFNYNVDRYGANAQPCYCGEANCIGFIGGKTQTESASLLPQFISEALGSSIEDEQEFILAKKEADSKIEKNENNINVEFVKSLIMKEIEIFEINKVMGVLMQSDDLLIVDRLLERIELSKNGATQHKLSLAHGYTSFGRLIKKFTEHKDRDKEVNDRKTVLISRILQIMENWPKVSKDHIQKVEIIPIIQQLQGLNLNDDITSACVRLLDRWSKFEALQRIKKSENALEKNSIILDDRRRERQKLSSPTRSTPSVVESTDGTDFIEGEFFTEVDAKRGLHPDWACAFDASQEKYYFYSKTSQETRWEKPTVSVPVVQSNNNGFSNVPGNNFNNNNAFSNNFVQYTDEEKEQYRQKKEREEKRRREQEILNKRVKQDNSIQEVIRRAKEEDERKRQEEIDRLRIIEEQRAKKKEQYKKKMLAKQKAKAKHESSRPSSASSESSEKVWKIFFAQHVPNMLKKYLEEIGKDNLKKCAKDLIDQLVSKEVKKGKAPPSKLDSEKYKKIKELVSIHMEKFLIKYRARQKRKLGEGSESSVSETNGKKQHS